MSDRWISAETEPKEGHFRGLMHWHAQMCRGILARWSSQPYLYVDLHAGPGILEFNGRTFAGSPLIAQDVLSRAGFPSLSLHYEQSPTVAARLAEALWTPTSLLDTPSMDTTPVTAEPCEQGFARWLDTNGRQPDRYGLVYADPIGKEIPHALLNHAAKMLPRVDLLSYVSATGYKRRGTRRFADDVAAVAKRYVLVREPLGAWQWTFVLWTNWEKFPEWRRIGLHRIESERGRQILDKLNLTDRELREASNTPLPFRLDGATVPDLPGVSEASAVPGDPGRGVREGSGHV